jgi:Flp pilus assembly pilin Flp
MSAVVALVHNLVFRRDEGQDLMEYGLLVALIAILVIGVATTIGTTVNNAFWETFSSVIASAS